MRVLVTGGLGTVVQGLSRDLSNRGHSVLGCDLAHDADELGLSLRSDVVSPGYAPCDVSEFRQRLRLFDAVGPFGLVYHCAVEFDRWNAKTSTNGCGERTRSARRT
jgi:dTDP-glucose 4,6-dehydratase